MGLKYAVQKTSGSGSIASSLTRSHQQDSTSPIVASLLGHLSFAARAVPAGRTFLRRLYDLDRATASIAPYKTICLSSIAVQDLGWWANTLRDWSGKLFLPLKKWIPAPDLKLKMDASGAYGYGAYFDGRWLHGQWKPS